ncbi:MAG: carboxypeptidase regulatory-like domain-containing protein [Acidobacteriota bacterium]|nr:carboxypeptidase regulatory-like domain-containing protein [Acidobacteriota bacterium]
MRLMRWVAAVLCLAGVITLLTMKDRLSLETVYKGESKPSHRTPELAEDKVVTPDAGVSDLSAPKEQATVANRVETRENLRRAAEPSDEQQTRSGRKKKSVRDRDDRAEKKRTHREEQRLYGIEGYVVDTMGRAVADAEIRVIEAEGNPAEIQLLTISGAPPDTLTDMDGYFEIDGEQGSRLHLSASKAGFLPVLQPDISSPAQQPLTLVMNMPGRVSGSVIADGAALPGVRVTLKPETQVGADPSTSPPRFAETDENGRFEIAGLTPCLFALEATAPGYLPHRLGGFRVDESETLDGIELQMEAGAALTVTVTEPDGRAAGDVRVAILPANEVSGQAATPDHIGKDGAFVFTGLASGLHRVEAEAKDTRRAVKEVEIMPGSQDLQLVLEGGVPVEGLVRGPEGEPVEGAELVLVPQEAGGRGQLATVKSVEDGSFVFDNQPRGNYHLKAFKEGFVQTGEAPVLVVGAKPLKGLTVNLAGGIVLSGRILGLHAEVFDKLRISAYEGKSASGIPFTGHAIAAGTYEVRGLPPGPLVLVAEYPPAGSRVQVELFLNAGVTDVQQDLDFNTGHVLKGYAMHNGLPAVGAQLHLAQQDGAYQAPGVVSGDGSFRFQGLPRGIYRLTLQHPATGLSHTETPAVEGDTEVRLDLETVRVTGWLIDRTGGEPLSGAALSLKPGMAEPSGSPFQTEADTRGYFSLGHVPTGRWRLLVHPSDHAPTEILLDLISGKSAEDLELAVELRPN